ncbi:MAG TPA: excinuclease ABC subunit UvrA [Saprospiraceae bacterium]|nr:excinuclease ABC subunit UvrA [Saprospiraceae bacterium]
MAVLKSKKEIVDRDDAWIDVIGAKEHNLKSINIRIPREKLVVITGISGSGKSSLAFDTIYAEGQRRYLETFSAYARQFLGGIERPDVEKIDGLSPVISIEQKTSGWNPRSTVGTITEIYDFLRLLYARAGEAYSYVTGEKMVQYTEDQIHQNVLEQFANEKIIILAPVVRGRKGHYRELFDQLRKQGYNKVRVDGEIIDLSPKMQVDRYKTHDIELVVDRLSVQSDKEARITSSLSTALRLGEGMLMVMKVGEETVRMYSKQLMCSVSGISYEEPSPNSFSFNSPYGACPTCGGLGEVTQVDMDKVIPDPNKSINDLGIAPFGEVRDNYTFKQLRQISKKYKFTFATPINEISKEAMNMILHGGSPGTTSAPDYLPHDLVFDLGAEGIINMLKRWYESTTSEKIRQWAEGFMTVDVCPDCEGYRIKKESRYFKINGLHIGQLANLDLGDLLTWFDSLEPNLSEKQKMIGRDVIKEIHNRLGFLVSVGLHYLQLNRPSRTLSGGETQRTRLATQIGSQLTGITYILDEPSIGLHQRDNQLLIHSLRELAAIGNSVLVVEHDKDIMLAADYLIDLGPGAGIHGGEVVAAGTPEEVLKSDGLTAAYLNGSMSIEIPAIRRKGNGNKIVLTGATGHNLKNVDLEIPLGCFICVTGVSGSGKSSLINETLYPILRREFYNSLERPLPYEKIEGMKYVDKVIEVDQSPIGRTPRSNPATYTGVFTDIRGLFAGVPEAKIRGYKPGRFSFNVKGGRCETCQGSGMRVIEMNFLPDVMVECETCMGKRYNRETLEIHYKTKSISDVLEMTVEQGVEFFEPVPSIYRKLKTLEEVGLGYITLGQQATTLSGGEAQRVKLAEELAKRDTGQTVYILDEPTTGLHFEDIKHLLRVIQSLVDRGNTAIVIEHQMDVIKVADYIIDIGLNGGKEGGRIVFAGTPEELATQSASHTASFLKLELL